MASTDTVTAAATQGRLAGKVLLVTGAAQGIGLAVAERAAAEGAEVVVSDIQVDGGKQAAASVGGTFVELDVTDAASIKQAVDSIVSRFGRIDVLVNNAGAALMANARNTSLDDFRWVLDIDLLGLFAVTREVGGHMIEAGSGSIVNVASISSVRASQPEELFAYSAAKAGVAQMTRNLAAEWTEYGIRTNAVSPGRINTPLLVENSTEAMREVFVSQTPIQRLIEPREVADPILFLASDEASAVNGVNLLIDGGQAILV